MTVEMHEQRNLARVVVGLIVITAGVLFTLDNLHIVYAGEIVENFWPIALVLIGLAQIAQSRSSGSVIWSLVLILAGLWTIGYNLGYTPIGVFQLWPLVLVAFGLSILWRAWSAPPAASEHGPTVLAASSVQTGVVAGESYVKGTAVFGSFERTIAVTDFRGADLVAIMGGCKLDLRKAVIGTQAAVIDVTAIMGGIELRIPENWSVDVRVSPFLGGVTDQTRRSSVPATQRLVLRGTVVMGGVEIKD